MFFFLHHFVCLQGGLRKALAVTEAPMKVTTDCQSHRKSRIGEVTWLLVWSRKYCSKMIQTTQGLTTWWTWWTHCWRGRWMVRWRWMEIEDGRLRRDMVEMVGEVDGG